MGIEPRVVPSSPFPVPGGVPEAGLVPRGIDLRPSGGENSAEEAEWALPSHGTLGVLVTVDSRANVCPLSFSASVRFVGEYV
jgi:hypothetical protein